MARLQTDRLILRSFRRADAKDFARLAGEWTVASMTSDIPYPFTPAQALGWLKPVRGEARFAIEHKGLLIGGVGFYRRPSGIAELGFWLGRPWWGHGYATEASRAVIRHGLGNVRLPGYSSAHFIDNPASARVLSKLGFRPRTQARMMCVARGCEVEAVTYWLDRNSAARVTPPLRLAESERSGWRTWLGLLGPT